jgi:tetratricopeptide (TPR) repeat protein
MSRMREEGDAAVDDLFEPLDGEAGPARRTSRQKSAALVMAAMEAAARETPPRPRVRGKRPPVWMMAAAVLFTGAAAAAVWRLASPEAPPVTVSAHEPVPVRHVADADPVQPVVEAPAPVRSPPAAARVERASPPARFQRAAEAPVEPQREEVAPVIHEPPPGIPPDAAPEDLLRKANELRAAGRWKEAEALYLHVIRAQSSTLAAYVALVASGSLRLEHLGNARGALQQFEEALRLQPQGMLGQEARHGMAEAWRELGDREAEARALAELLSLHPDSPFAASARARLRELSGP